MKYNYLFIFFLLCFFHSASQSLDLNGAAIYEIRDIGMPKSVLDFWFNQNQYVYSLRQKSFRETQSYKFFLEKVQNKKDSIDFERLVDSLNVKNSNLPLKYVYGNISNNVTLQRELDNTGQPVCVIDTLFFIKWTLQNERKLLSGYSCQKATGTFSGTEYEAWFTDKIPLSVAPFQLRGLPGLIIQMQNKSTNRIISLVSVNWPTNSKSFNFCDYKNAISRVTYLKKYKLNQPNNLEKIKGSKTITDLLENIRQ